MVILKNLNKTNHFFQFKQFGVSDKLCAMKVGTDSVLLGSWTNPEEAGTILDIGTGCGILALMMAQKSKAETTIDALDFDEKACEQAAINFSNSPWNPKLHIFQTPLQTFNPVNKKYDLIISNPPFFSTGIASPDPSRFKARHQASMTYGDLIHFSMKFLASEGTLNLIIPFNCRLLFITQAAELGLYTNRQTYFYSRANKPPERVLLQLSQKLRPCQTDLLYKHSDGYQLSEAFMELTGEFYL